MFLLAKDYRTKTFRVARGAPYFRRYGRGGSGFKTGDFVTQFNQEIRPGYRRTTLILTKKNGNAQPDELYYKDTNTHQTHCWNDID